MLEIAGGDIIRADLVVVGAGAAPDDRLAAEAGLATDNGIVVDEQCRSSDPAIFAAGDVVRFPGPHGLVRQEDWRHAQDQGSVAGRNAAVPAIPIAARRRSGRSSSASTSRASAGRRPSRNGGCGGRARA